MKLLNHIFKFKRLTWMDYVKLQSSLDRKGILAKSLVEISGKLMTFQESQIVLKALPSDIIAKVYTIFIGSQDERRKFSSTPLWEAPSALEHVENLKKDEDSKDAAVSMVEKQLEEKFGKEALDEEKEINRQIIQKSGYKGAIRLAKESMEKLDSELA